jgi:O-antigen/teichoic acid export membrane protein
VISAKLRQRIGWGFLDQGLSSLTNFGLSLVTGRWLGPAALGQVAIGFAAYLIALTFQRALITDQLVIVTSVAVPERAATSTRMALGMCIEFAVVVTVLLSGVAVVVGGTVGRGLLLVAPWLMPLLIQDAWRVILFRDQRGQNAVANDATWVLGMILGLIPAWFIHNAWAIVAAWGFGAACGGLLGFFQTRYGVARLRESWRWWRAEAWPFARWWGTARAAFTVGAQGAVFLLAALITATELGGFRAVQALFAPLSLILPAVGLPGLPTMAELYHSAPRSAWLLALRLSAGVTSLAVAYMALLIAFRARAIGLVFGHAFHGFGDIILPVAINQVILATRTGLILLLMAARRGRALLISHVSSAIVTLVLAGWLAVWGGVVAASWGIALGSLIGTGMIMFSAIQLHSAAPDKIGKDKTTSGTPDW